MIQEQNQHSYAVSQIVDFKIIAVVLSAIQQISPQMGLNAEYLILFKFGVGAMVKSFGLV